MSSKAAGTPAKMSEGTATEDTSESTQPSEGSTSIKESPSSSISSPPSKLSSLAKFLTSPRRSKTSKQPKAKKSTKKSISGKGKSKNVEHKVEENVGENKTMETSSKNLLCESGEARGDIRSVVTSPRRGGDGQKECGPSMPGKVKDKDVSKRTMTQTNLATGKDGIEVISSPEQQVEKKKGNKTSSKRKESQEKGKKQTRITSIFPVRKSNRKCKSEQEKDEQARITKAILSKIFEGLEVCTIEGKGRGVFASRDFARNEFVCEYSGELISCDEAKKREITYGKDKNIGCYMYYLKCNNKNYCVDATAEDGTFGRLLNHSKKGNCKTKVHVIEDIPHLIFVTNHTIKQGEELTYDYGDRSKDALQSHPWLKY